MSNAVTIGMPVYNAERTVRAAIEALLAQSYREFLLIISDNASTDQTAAICRSYADPRIRYIRQAVNIGAKQNFRFVLEQATTEYFMWAASDDTRSPDFLALNVAFLETHSDYVASTSPTHFKGRARNSRIGDASLSDDDAYARVIKPFSAWHCNARMYSLFKREALDWGRDSHFLGWDWDLISHVAARGKMNCVSGGWVELGADGMSNSTDVFAHYRRSVGDWLLPFGRLMAHTFGVVAHATLRQKIRLASQFAKLNANAFLQQFYVMIKRRHS